MIRRQPQERSVQIESRNRSWRGMCGRGRRKSRARNCVKRREADVREREVKRTADRTRNIRVLIYEWVGVENFVYSRSNIVNGGAGPGREGARPGRIGRGEHHHSGSRARAADGMQVDQRGNRYRLAEGEER